MKPEQSLVRVAHLRATARPAVTLWCAVLLRRVARMLHLLLSCSV